MNIDIYKDKPYITKKAADKYLIFIKAKPNAKANKIDMNDIYQDDKGYWLQVTIKAQAKDGKANKELVNVLADLFDIAKSKITLIRGANAKYKVFEITDKST